MMIVRAEEITKEFIRKREASNVFTAVQETNLELSSGKLTVLYGSSGSGKTTLLSILSGVLVPTTGRVYYGDTSIYDMTDDKRSRLRREQLSLVPQGQTAIQSLTVMENVLLPFTLANEVIDEDVIKRAQENLDKVGILDLKDVFPSELSGGELRRVAFARSFTRNSDILILDEPTADLDEKNAIKIISLLKAYAEDHVVLAATHDRDLRDAADILYRMEEGKLLLDEGFQP